MTADVHPVSSMIPAAALSIRSRWAVRPTVPSSSEKLAALRSQSRTYARISGNTKRLMALPGVDRAVAVGLMAAIGRIHRASRPDKLVACIGLNPSIRQSGDRSGTTDGRARR